MVNYPLPFRDPQHRELYFSGLRLAMGETTGPPLPPRRSPGKIAEVCLGAALPPFTGTGAKGPLPPIAAGADFEPANPPKQLSKLIIYYRLS